MGGVAIEVAIDLVTRRCIWVSESRCLHAETRARAPGWLEGPDGKASIGEQFDTNEDDDSDPLLLILGEGRGIWALEEGVVGMKEGGTRRLVSVLRVGLRVCYRSLCLSPYMFAIERWC